MQKSALPIGALIVIAVLLVLFVALSGTGTAAGPSSPPSSAADWQVRVRLAWSHLLAGLNSRALAASANRSCLTFSAWLDRTDERLVSFLALHGMHVARWQASTKWCSSGASG